MYRRAASAMRLESKPDYYIVQRLLHRALICFETSNNVVGVIIYFNLQFFIESDHIRDDIYEVELEANPDKVGELKKLQEMRKKQKDANIQHSPERSKSPPKRSASPSKKKKKKFKKMKE
jgi:hypothetical protein